MSTSCAIPYTIASVSAIVAAASANGTSTANEIPRTAMSTASAIGRAIVSPRFRSEERIGSRSCWIAGWPLTYARGSPASARRTVGVYFFACCRSSVVWISAHVTPPAERSCSTWPVGTTPAAAARRARIWRRSPRVPKTTVKTPSVRSRKSFARIVRACSESVPGTANVVARRPVRRIAPNAPTATTAIQHTRIGARRRRTARVQRSGTGSAYDAGREAAGLHPRRGRRRRARSGRGRLADGAARDRPRRPGLPRLGHGRLATAGADPHDRVEARRPSADPDQLPDVVRLLPALRAEASAREPADVCGHRAHHCLRPRGRLPPAGRERRELGADGHDDARPRQHARPDGSRAVMPIDVRPVRDRDEFARAFYAIGQYFGGPPPEDMLDRWMEYFELARMRAAFEDGEIVGGAGAFTLELSVPGGSLPCAGVTVVGTYPTHRRRGALRGMMDAQLADVHERGEPIAALWASEETIYGRFGYGLAAWSGEVKIPRGVADFAQPFTPAGRVRFLTPEEAATLFPLVWQELRRQRPAVPTRSAAWWELR